MTAEQLNQAIAAFKSGDKAFAQRLLTHLVKVEPRNESAWLWLSACVSSSDQKIYCLKKVLEINPKNLNAQKALDQLIPPEDPSLDDIIQTTTSPIQPIPSTQNHPLVEAMIRLNCPSCGAALELAKNLDETLCMFCGSRILLHPNDSVRERKNIQRLRELLNVAVRAKNYDEAIGYCNSILQIEPEDIDTWIIKASVVCDASSEKNDRYEESVAYLRRAALLSPNDERIAEAFEKQRREHFQWLMLLAAEDASKSTEGIPTGYIRTERMTQALENNIKALRLYPDNIQALEALELMLKSAAVFGLNAGIEGQKNMAVLAALRRKKAAETLISELRTQLYKQNEVLKKLQSQGGFMAGTRIKAAESEIRRLEKLIAGAEETAAYQPPKVQLIES